MKTEKQIRGFGPFMKRVSGVVRDAASGFADKAADLRDIAGSAMDRTPGFRDYSRLRSTSSEEFCPMPDDPVERVTVMPDGQCVYAIGDIHGRLDLLERLMDTIRDDTADLPEDTKITLVFLGDYIDRGLHSRQVVDYFLGDALDGFETVFLMGNHEEALLRFHSDASFGEQWASYGGKETLYSYGFPPPPPSNGNPEADALAQSAWATLWNRFRTELPEDHLAFYRDLKPHFGVGDYVFVHAGLRPGIPMEFQSERDLYWIRDEFLYDTEEFPQMVVHGHTPEDQVYHDHRRIGVDTGAYISGKLTAVRLFGEDVTFLET